MSPNFRKGGDAGEEASAKASVRFAKVEYFSLEDKEQGLLRFLTEHTDWITVDQHQMVPTKPKPADYEGNWPDKMGAVCRKDKAFDYGDCYICDFGLEKGKGGKVKRPQPRTWALACRREEVIENGRVVGIKDKLREVQRKKEGSDETETVIEKDIVVVRFAWSNFWHNIQAAAGHYKTVLDRDYLVKRKGSGLDTDYSILPIDPVPAANGEVFDLRNPEFMKLYANEYDLENIITRQSEDEFYARFFDPRVTVTKEGAVTETGADPTPKADNDVSEDRLKALKDRVTNYGANGGGQPNDQPATEPEAANPPMRNFS